jgi:dihydroorotate dehydrogenase
MYKEFVKPVLFNMNAEFVHESALILGHYLGKSALAKTQLSQHFVYKSPTLEQNIAGISFKNPVGLAAGFDYDAKLTQILPRFGFGFETIGTVTNIPYSGNPRPRLGRLPHSKSLLVNKGFKSKGTDNIIEKLSEEFFDIPVGISIGRSNSAQLETQEQSINDILTSFDKFEKSTIKNSYYELNISCPNLIHGNKKISFYDETNLTELLTALNKLKIKKPIFVKMPIVLPNENVLQLLEVIKRFEITGVIFGNLESNRQNPQIIANEVKKFKMGNFSGKPTFTRSNELIELTYKNYKNKLLIIGCGGIFSAQDAYKKIKLGANLVQLITGMIYEGPSLIKQINMGLTEFLKADGFTNIAQAVGKEAGYKIA